MTHSCVLQTLSIEVHLLQCCNTALRSHPRRTTVTTWGPEKTSPRFTGTGEQPYFQNYNSHGIATLRPRSHPRSRHSMGTGNSFSTIYRDRRTPSSVYRNRNDSHPLQAKPGYGVPNLDTHVLAYSCTLSRSGRHIVQITSISVDIVAVIILMVLL